MAGLMNAAPQPGPQVAPPPGPAGPPPAPPDDQGGVTPEEQQTYDEVVARGTMLLFDGKSKKIRSGILEMLKADPEDPATCLGEAAGTILSRVDEALAEGGVAADDDLKMQAAAEIFEQVAEATTAAGIYDFEQDDDAFNKAWLIAIDTARQNAQAAGRADPEQDRMNFDEIAAADQDGRLDALMGQLGGAQPSDAPPEPPAPPASRGLMGGR